VGRALTIARVLGAALIVVASPSCGDASMSNATDTPDGSIADSQPISGDSGVPRTPGPPLQIELGTGDSEFMPLEHGDLVPLHYGPQGGYHLWMALRVHEGSAGSLRLNIQLIDDQGAPLFERSLRDRVSSIPDDLTGIAVYVRSPERVLGHQGCFGRHRRRRVRSKLRSNADRNGYDGAALMPPGRVFA
jgi:hypothetical protein